MSKFASAFVMSATWLAIVMGIPTSAADTEIRVTYSPANVSEMYEAVAKAFMAEHPEISVTLSGAPGYPELMQQTLRAQITGNLPDVSHEGLNLIRVYADRKMAVPLGTFIAKEDWADLGYSDAIRRVGEVNGISYAIPFAVSTQNVFFNLDLVKRSGGNPDHLPSNWPDIIDLAKRINALGNGISGIYFDYGANAALAFETLVFSQGGRMMTADERDIAFDGPEGLWAMDMLRRFGEAGQIDMSRENARQAFTAGVLGVYQNTSYNLGNFDKQISGAFQYTIVPVPTKGPGTLPASGNGMVMFSQTPEKQEAAWEYMKFASGPKGQAIMAKMTGYIPVNGKVLLDPEMKRFYTENPNYAVPLTQISSLTGWYAFPGKNGLKITEAINEKMREVITLRTPPLQALTQVSAAVRKLLAENSQ